MFPEGKRRACITPPTPRSGSSTRSTVTSRSPATATTLQLLLPEARSRSSTHHIAARGSASAWIRPTACCARGRRAISSPGWTPRWATGSSRRGAARRSRSTRSGTTRCGCSRAGSASATATTPRDRCAADTPKRPARRSTSGSGTRTAAICTTSSTARTATTPRAGRIRSSPISLRHPVLDARAGSRVLDGRAASGCSRPSACGRSLPAIPTTSRSTTATCAPATRAYHQGTVWAWLIGPFIDAWLKVAPRRPRRRAPIPRRVRPAPRRGVRRHHQRDLRRRAALHSARLRRAGLERRGGAALLGQDGRTWGGRARRVATGGTRRHDARLSGDVLIGYLPLHRVGRTGHGRK